MFCENRSARRFLSGDLRFPRADECTDLTASAALRSRQNHLSALGWCDLFEFYRSLVAHIEAVVAAEHDAFRADFLNQELHHRFRVHDRIVREALRRRLAAGASAAIDLCANLGAVIGSSNQHGQRPAVRQTNLQFPDGDPEPRRQKSGGSYDGRVEWIAQ